MTPIAPSPAVVISPELSSATVPPVLPDPPLPPIEAEIEMAGISGSPERSTARAAAIPPLPPPPPMLWIIDAVASAP